MKTAHAGKTTTESHWKAFMEQLAASLDTAKVQPKEKAGAGTFHEAEAGDWNQAMKWLCVRLASEHELYHT